MFHSHINSVNGGKKFPEREGFCFKIYRIIAYFFPTYSIRKDEWIHPAYGAIQFSPPLKGTGLSQHVEEQ